MSREIIALAFFNKFSPRVYQQITRGFSSPSQIWRAGREEMTRIGLSENFIGEFLSWRKENPIEKNQGILITKKINAVTLTDQEYPAALREIPDPPPVLFYRGNIQDIIPAVAVVGTRKISPYAEAVTREIVPGLATNGLIIVSGLALGVDGVAHRATLAVGGRTLAILGGSVVADEIYPSAHQNLAEEIIAKNGAVISEYPPGFSPTVYSFPLRNRIIAGLSQGVLIVEAPKKSGALITANAALDYNREIFCVPHPIFSPGGAGGNELLRLGAKFILSAEDILSDLGLKIKTNEPIKETPPKMTATEKKIYDLISDAPRSIDEIIRLTGQNGAEVNSAIALMEISGWIKNLGKMTYGPIK